MKIFLSLVTTILLNLISINAFAIDKSMSVEDVLVLIQSRVEADEYKLDMLEDNVSLQYLKTWPVEILGGLKKALTDDKYFISDDDQLGALIDYIDPSGEYSVSGKIVRSVTVNLQSEVLFVAIYSAYGGEWGRESEFKFFYVLDSKGNLISEQIY